MVGVQANGPDSINNGSLRNRTVAACVRNRNEEFFTLALVPKLVWHKCRQGPNRSRLDGPG
jgi:hypothetical protein